MTNAIKVLLQMTSVSLQPVKPLNRKNSIKDSFAEGPSNTHLFLNPPLRGSFRNFKFMLEEMPSATFILIYYGVIKKDCLSW
jgi:hypothetical protein